MLLGRFESCVREAVEVRLNSPKSNLAIRLDGPGSLDGLNLPGVEAVGVLLDFTQAQVGHASGRLDAVLKGMGLGKQFWQIGTFCAD